MKHLCLIGLGEVGRILAEDLLKSGIDRIAAWDVKFGNRDSAPAQTCQDLGLRPAGNAVEAALDAEIVISAVTAGQAVEAAASTAAGGLSGAVFLDLNSVSPQAKTKAAAIVEAAGGRYVEAAVMSPVPPTRIKVPMLLGGPHAKDFLPAAQGLGFTGASVFSDRVGQASAAKMCRSVVVKGLEALWLESIVSARFYGVEDTVLSSLKDFFPGSDPHELARYMISRSIEHGKRRAEEMREAAKTVAEAGLQPAMADATVARQDWAAGRVAAPHDDLNDMLDAVLTSLQSSVEQSSP